jgi:hypothetical protein
MERSRVCALSLVIFGTPLGCGDRDVIEHDTPEQANARAVQVCGPLPEGRDAMTVIRSAAATEPEHGVRVSLTNVSDGPQPRTVSWSIEPRALVPGDYELDELHELRFEIAGEQVQDIVGTLELTRVDDVCIVGVLHDVGDGSRPLEDPLSGAFAAPRVPSR